MFDPHLPTTDRMPRPKSWDAECARIAARVSEHNRAKKLGCENGFSGEYDETPRHWECVGYWAVRQGELTSEPFYLGNCSLAVATAAVDRVLADRAEAAGFPGSQSRTDLIHVLDLQRRDPEVRQIIPKDPSSRGDLLFKGTPIAHGQEPMILHADGRVELPGMITLHPNGRAVLLADGYQPDAMARRFWDAVALARDAAGCREAPAGPMPPDQSGEGEISPSNLNDLLKTAGIPGNWAMGQGGKRDRQGKQNETPSWTVGHLWTIVRNWIDSVTKLTERVADLEASVSERAGRHVVEIDALRERVAMLERAQAVAQAPNVYGPGLDNLAEAAQRDRFGPGGTAELEARLRTLPIQDRNGRETPFGSAFRGRVRDIEIGFPEASPTHVIDAALRTLAANGYVEAQRALQDMAARGLKFNLKYPQ